MTTIDRTNATDTEFAERIAAFNTATVPIEILREELARAIWDVSDEREDDPSVEWENNYARDEWYRMADAVIAVWPR